MRPTEHLRALASEDWRAVAEHAFCQEIAAGTLPGEKMAWYLVEDYRFVDGFVRLLAASIVHAPSLDDSIPTAQFLGLVTDTENTYFQRSFEALGVTAADRARPPAPPTRGFQEIMARAAASGSYARMLAVLVVAEWSYLSWAAPHWPRSPDLPFWLGEWIDLHAGAGFEGVVAHLRGQLDAAWEGLDAGERAAVEALFVEAVALERAFFDAAYASGQAGAGTAPGRGRSLV